MASTCLHAIKVGRSRVLVNLNVRLRRGLSRWATLISGDLLIQCINYDKGHTLPGMILMAHLLWSSSPGPFVVPCLTQARAVNIMQSPWPSLQANLTGKFRHSCCSQILQPQHTDASMPQCFDAAIQRQCKGSASDISGELLRRTPMMWCSARSFLEYCAEKLT